MGWVYEAASAVGRAVPVLAAKLGSVMLLLFSLGMVLGYALAVRGSSPLYLAAPFVALWVMWRDLDEGVLVLAVLLALIYLFPDFLPF